MPFIGDDPLAWYLPHTDVVRHGDVRASEVDVVGWALRREHTPPPPAPGFRLVSRRHSGKLTLLRFTSPRAVTFTRAQLSAERLGKEHGAVLVQKP